MTVQDPTVSAILARLDTLERQNARLKTVGATIVLLALSVPLLMGQARTAKVLEANEFLLKDASGRVRARLGIGATGLPASAPADLASLELYDPTAKPVVRLIAGAGDESLMVGVLSPETPAIAMDVNGKGALLTIVAGKSGARREVNLNANPNEAFVAITSLGKGHGISLMDSGPLKNPQIAVFDKNANVIWTAP